MLLNTIHQLKCEGGNLSLSGKRKISCHTCVHCLTFLFAINASQESVKSVLRVYFLKLLRAESGHSWKNTKKQRVHPTNVPITVIFTLLLFCEENKSVVRTFSLNYPRCRVTEFTQRSIWLLYKYRFIHPGLIPPSLRKGCNYFNVLYRIE